MTAKTSILPLPKTMEFSKEDNDPPSGFPSLKMLAAQSPKHYSLPKHLCGHDAMIDPQDENLLNFVLEHGKGGLFSRNGNISISTDAREAYAGGVSMLDFRRKFNQGCFLLRDNNDAPLVLCLQDRRLLQASAYFIHGRQPLLEANDDDQQQQKPVATQDGVDFFPWYRVEHSHYGATLAHCAKISKWNAATQKYEPLLMAKHAKFELLNKYSDERKVSSNGEILFTTAGAVDNDNSSNDDRHYDYGFVTRNASNPKTVQWNLTIAPGVDSALMICLTAIMEEFVGCVG